MPRNTYVALDTTTVVTATPSITFSNISQAYTDLVLVVTGASSNGFAGYIGTQFNSDASSSYATTRLLGDGNVASSDRYTNSTLCKSGTMWGSIGTNIFQVMNYSNSVTYKTMLNRDNNAGNRVGGTLSLWRSTNAITSVTFTCPDGGGFASNSTFSLYGIKSWSDEVSPKATGGYVYEDSSYWYHAFPFSSTFTPSQSITADILVVAGGGGGGYGGNAGGAGPGGGGGAGGLLAHSSQSLSATSYTVTVGAGGGYGTGDGVKGYNGSNSQFGSLTASVGGGGGGSFSISAKNGADGGSGGGGATYSGAGTGGSPTSGQGYAGGTGLESAPAAGGGGGAGAAGTTPTNNAGGKGGDGTSAYSSWGTATKTGEIANGTVYYAGGGGGASRNATWQALGGYGGGGKGTYSGNGTGLNGLVSTGGGGGGGSNYIVGGIGGSGVVIVRYAK